MQPFSFNQKYYVFPGDILDLSVINAVIPAPDDATVDIEEARAEWKHDIINVRDTYLMGGRPGIEGNFRILLNHRDWALFWAVRDPDPAKREEHLFVLYQLNGSLRRITEKARAYLLRRMQA